MAGGNTVNRYSWLIGALAAGVLACADLDRAALAQESPAKPEESKTASARLVSSGWNVGCQPAGGAGELLCEASQVVALQESRQALLTVFVTPWAETGDRDAFLLRFQLPHGLDLPAGVQLAVDGKSVPSPVIQTSSQIGVFARATLTETLLATLKKGTTLTVEFSAMNGNKLSVPVTLNGFSAVFAKLTQP